MLLKLHREIDSRTGEIASAHGAWPCRKGCDDCCRSLAEMPRLTPPEWDLVTRGLQQLAPGARAEVHARIEEAALGNTKTCPFLDRAKGSCLIYEHRPVACRTYGFYVERDRGLYCHRIEKDVDAGRMSNVVWGNVAAVEAALAPFGETIPLTDWHGGGDRP